MRRLFVSLLFFLAVAGPAFAGSTLTKEEIRLAHLFDPRAGGRHDGAIVLPPLLPHLDLAVRGGAREVRIGSQLLDVAVGGGIRFVGRDVLIEIAVAVDVREGARDAAELRAVAGVVGR